MTPFFSIIIPTYNRAHTIQRPIDSVLAQTFTDWELIIVDDGSTDDTKSLVESYQDERIRYVWQENKERSAARNHGIRLAQGEWICFLDSDDAYISNHLQSFYIGISDYPGYDMYRTGLIIMDEGRIVAKSDLEPIQVFYNTYPNDFIVIYAFKRCVFNYEIFDKNFRYMEDMHFLVRITSRFSFIQLKVHTYKYFYDPHNTGSLSRNYKLIIDNKVDCISDMLNFPIIQHKKYLKWVYVVNMILYLRGCIIYDLNEIINGLHKNFNTLLKYPLTYTNVILRIAFVKLFENIFKRKFKFRF